MARRKRKTPVKPSARSSPVTAASVVLDGHGGSRAIGRLIREQRIFAGRSQQELATAAGISKAYLSLVESGQRTLSLDRAAAVERALGMDDRQLQQAIEWQRVPARIRRQVQRTHTQRLDMHQRLQRALSSDDPLAALRNLVADTGANEDGAVDVAAAASAAADDRSVSGAAIELLRTPMPMMQPIPIINKVAAGYPREFTDMDRHPAAMPPPFDADEHLCCPNVADPDAFAARVVGDSMEPAYREGDIVVFSPAARIAPEGGCDCFVRLERDAEMTFKRIYFEDAGRVIRLQPLNSAYPPMTFRREDVSGLYAAVYVLRRVGR